MASIFNAVASPVDKGSGKVSVIDDLQNALAKSLRPDDAPRLQQPLVHKIIRYAMEFAMFSGLSVDTMFDGTVRVHSVEPKQTRSLPRVESDTYCLRLSDCSVCFVVHTVQCLHGSLR